MIAVAWPVAGGAHADPASLDLARELRALARQEAQREQDAPRLPPLHVPGEPYRTPRAGQGFHTTVFGREVDVPPDDRRSVNAWDVGAAATAPGPPGAGVLPFGSLYFWRRPDEDELLRAIVLGIYNDVFWARSHDGWGDWETVVTFENLVAPVSQAEIVDGAQREEEELSYSWGRLGLGVGMREEIAPGSTQNMRAVSLLVEPGWLAFDDGSDADPTFVEPEDSFELRLHLHTRWDALERNLLELPHAGFAWGADLVGGWRDGWEDWGLAASQTGGDDFRFATAYLVGATGVPGAGERHRLVGSLHVGAGEDTDRFSAPRVGGGPQGEDYGVLARPVLPGTAINEFYPEDYAILLGEYRFEPIFFSYLSLRGSLAALDVDRDRNGVIVREDDTFSSLGFRITTGFFFESRLQLDYDYQFGVVRDGSPGGHGVVLHVSKSF